MLIFTAMHGNYVHDTVVLVLSHYKIRKIGCQKLLFLRHFVWLSMEPMDSPMKFGPLAALRPLKTARGPFRG